MQSVLVDEVEFDCNCFEVHMQNLECIFKHVFYEGGAIKSPIIKKNKYESYLNDEIKKKRKVMGKGNQLGNLFR